MSDKLHKILADLGDTINQEILDAPSPAPEITDRSLSGNKINGGKIANFASTGIKDNATYYVTFINDTLYNFQYNDGLHEAIITSGIKVFQQVSDSINILKILERTQLELSDDDIMPPSPNTPLSDCQILLFQNWVDQGALNN